MKIKNLIKHSLISIFTLSFILINNINIAFACGSPAMAEVYATLEKISGEMRMPPLLLVCLLYGGCYNDMNAIEKYTNDIAKNLNNLKGKIGNAEFGKLWDIPHAPSEETIGKKLQEFLGLTKATPESEIVHEKSTGVVLNAYKKMLDSTGIPPEDEAGYNKLREELKKFKKPLKEVMLPLLDKTQFEVFVELDELDKKIEESKEAINEFHETEIEEHKKASEIQALCKSRIDLVKENLSNLLGDIEKNLSAFASIAPDNIEHSIEHIICFSKIRQAIMNMSYITMPDYLSRSLDRRVQLRAIVPEKGPAVDIIRCQREIGGLQTRISFLREPIIQLTIEPIIVKKREPPQDEEGTSAKGGHTAKKSKAVIMAPYIPWQNSELATGISEKLNTYSLNQHHFLRKDVSAGMDKAHEIWTSLGYINEDSGFFEARIRQAVGKSQICDVTGRQNLKKDIETQKDKYYGDTYTVVIEVPSIDLKKQTILTSWEYKKVEVETADNYIVLLSYPRCVTIYKK